MIFKLAEKFRSIEILKFREILKFLKSTISQNFENRLIKKFYLAPLWQNFRGRISPFVCSALINSTFMAL
ncbi:MAG: hypothetical protein ACLVCW_02295 [Campylobacter sp.]